MTTTTNEKSIMTLAAEQYVSNCKQDSEFTNLHPNDIISCICVDLQDLLGRLLTDEEDEMTEEALLMFGVKWQ